MFLLRYNYELNVKHRSSPGASTLPTLRDFRVRVLICAGLAAAGPEPMLSVQTFAGKRAHS